jgi:anaerobic magnesium-protoporphyrin IX monomethyl ester cyclase
MKIILVHPPSRQLKREDVVVPPLGLAYLAGSLERKGHRVMILDAFALGMNWGEFEDEIKKRKPDLIGMGGMTPTIDNTLRAAKICRPHTCTLVVGGPHVSVLQQEFFRECPEADFGVVGEGEAVFVGLVKRLEEGKDPWEVPGLVGPERANLPGKFIEDLDSIPFPSRHLLPNHAYRYALWPGKKITTLITSRGCPYHCIFCDKSVFGSRWRARSPGNVLDEMEQIVKDLRIRSMILYDDLFIVNKQRAIEVCQGILERGLRVEWKCEGRVDRVDEEMLRWMKKAGCSLIAYGVESGNQQGLDYLRKKTTLSQIRRAFDLTHKAGIRPMAYFILGIPVETFEGGLKTIEFAKELKPEYAQFSILSPYRGTDLYEEAVGRGWYREVDANNPFDKDQKRPVVLSENWSEEQLREILKKAHRRFYFRGGYILNRLRGVRSLQGIRSLGEVGWGLLRWYFSRGGSR